MSRSVAVPVMLLAALTEATKRVLPRGVEDADRLHDLVEQAERILGYPAR
jgi:hypothetical protein